MRRDHNYGYSNPWPDPYWIRVKQLQSVGLSNPGPDPNRTREVLRFILPDAKAGPPWTIICEPIQLTGNLTFGLWVGPISLPTVSLGLEPLICCWVLNVLFLMTHEGECLFGNCEPIQLTGNLTFAQSSILLLGHHAHRYNVDSYWPLAGLVGYDCIARGQTDYPLGSGTLPSGL